MVLITESFEPEDFEVAIICALGLEYNSVCSVFDEVWDQHAGDLNYKVGRIGKHKVVLAMLSGMGKASAASTAAVILKDFPKMRIAFLVGICGGVPTPGKREILLGDVVISSGILQYDFGKQYPNTFSTQESFDGYISKPDKCIRDQLWKLNTDEKRDFIQQRTSELLRIFQAGAAERGVSDEYKYPGAAKDKLFKPEYRHKHRVLSGKLKCTLCDDGRESSCHSALGSSCETLGCEKTPECLVQRERLRGAGMSAGEISYKPFIHLGVVGSGDTVIKSAEHRDGLAKIPKIIAFEMEGAGISDNIQCIVVKGVCDYADSHKNKDWQGFAAATAASALKAMLEYFPLYNSRIERAHTPQPPQSPRSPSKTQVVSEQAPSPNSDQERRKRVKEVRQQLPALVQTLSEDLTKRLRWTPYLGAAPSAICVMASCLVAGTSECTGSIEISIPPMTINGVTITPGKYLGTNLTECSTLGNTAFKRAENGMKILQNRAEFVTGRTGPLSQIVLLLNDSHPNFSSLEMWMKSLADAAAICLKEASDMRASFEVLLGFIKALRKATVEAFHESDKQLKKKEKDIKAVKDQHELQIEQVEAEKEKFGSELEDAKKNLQTAQEKMSEIVKANANKARIEAIDSRLQEIKHSESRGWTTFGRFFGKGKPDNETQEEKQNLKAEKKELLKKGGEGANADQTSASIKELDACKARVEEAECSLRACERKHDELMKEKGQFQSVNTFNTAFEDLRTLSDKNLDLEAITGILKRSIKALKNLNSYIDKMSSFFIEVSTYVNDTMGLRLSQFKNQTGDVANLAKSRTEEENNRHKASAMVTALDLHGRFTLIHKISGVYVDVSQKYIGPGMNSMDELAYLDDDEYAEEMKRFQDWGKTAVEEIDKLAAETNLKIEKEVFKDMGALARKQIGIEDIGDQFDSVY